MDWHAWRVPIVLGVIASASLLLFAVAVMAALIARRRSAATKVAAVGLLSLLVIVTGTKHSCERQNPRAVVQR